MKPAAAGGFELDHDKLKRTVGIAMRMLDNVIDINYYAVKKAKDSNERHRPVGMRSEEHTSELQSLMRISYAVFCLKKKNHHKQHNSTTTTHNKRFTTDKPTHI